MPSYYVVAEICDDTSVKGHEVFALPTPSMALALVASIRKHDAESRTAGVRNIGAVITVDDVLVHSALINAWWNELCQIDTARVDLDNRHSVYQRLGEFAVPIKRSKILQAEGTGHI